MPTDFGSGEEALAAVRTEFGEPRLAVELVPKSMWGINLRALLRRTDWDKVRRATYAKAGDRCEICGGSGRRRPVECHEVWYFDDSRSIQRLIGLRALCPTCHLATHYGRAIVAGFVLEAQLQLEAVNGRSGSQMRRYIALEFVLWEFRNRREWDLDLIWLSRFRVSPSTKAFAAWCARDTRRSRHLDRTPVIIRP